MSRKRILVPLLVGLTLGGTALAVIGLPGGGGGPGTRGTGAVEDPARSGASLAAGCAACHGTDGRGSGTEVPPLAGQPRESLEERMLALRAGGDGGALMHQLARGYTEEEIARISAYLSSLPPARRQP